MIYLKLFWSFFQIGLFSFGGGYAAMPLIQNQVVDIHGWLTMNEFADVVTISQMTPGPIGINAATFVGTRIGGVTGAIIATLGCILPSCIIALSLAYIYRKYSNITAVQGVLSGLRPAVAAMITLAGLGLIRLAFWKGSTVTGGLKTMDYKAVLIFAGCFLLLRKWKVNPVHIMLGSGLIGLFAYQFRFF